MAEYTPQEYPKFLAEFGCVVDSKEQEEAMRSGRAEVVETRSAQGSTYIATPKKAKAKKRGDE